MKIFRDSKGRQVAQVASSGMGKVCICFDKLWFSESGAMLPLTAQRFARWVMNVYADEALDEILEQQDTRPR